MVKKICLYCGSSFEVPNKRKDTAKYCCKSCYDKAQSKQVTYACEWCGKLVTRKLSLYQKNKHHFCSIKCVGLWNSERTNTHVTKKCIICGKEYSVKRNEAEKSVTCSIECQGNGKVNIEWVKTLVIGVAVA